MEDCRLPHPYRIVLVPRHEETRECDRAGRYWGIDSKKRRVAQQSSGESIVLMIQTLKESKTRHITPSKLKISVIERSVRTFCSAITPTAKKLNHRQFPSTYIHREAWPNAINCSSESHQTPNNLTLPRQFRTAKKPNRYLRENGSE